MEGVEDIPGTALSEGIDWSWETFPEYLDALEQPRVRRSTSACRSRTAPCGRTRWASAALRNEPATPEDIAAMAAIVREADRGRRARVLDSRTLGHRAMDGEPGARARSPPKTSCSRSVAAMAAGGRSRVFELAPMGAAGEDIVAPKNEMDWMCRLAGEIGMPVSFALEQVQAAPDLWRELMDESIDATDAGRPVYPQVAARPFGMLLGFPSRHAFAAGPTSGRCGPAARREELAAELRQAGVRGRDPGRGRPPADPAALFEALGTPMDVAARPHLPARRSARLRAHGRPHDRRAWQRPTVSTRSRSSTT